MAIKTKKNAAGESTFINENRGRDDVRQNYKKIGTSKDVVASLYQRVAGVETSMMKLKNQVKGLESLDFDFTSMREDFRVALNTLSGDLKREIYDLEIRSWARSRRYERSMEKSGNTKYSPKIDVPKPSPFMGKQDARAVDDFLWEMEQYLVEVILFYNGLEVPTRKFLDSKGAIPTKTVVDAAITIPRVGRIILRNRQQKHLRTRSTETLTVAAI
ncbi:hypothetical protein Tco_0464115 [Tanacetum coccineum]